ncbi:MAG: PEP/pyruvate-binding domain-containing protein, partial [Candidatus Hodarchaeota archaeon]
MAQKSSNSLVCAFNKLNGKDQLKAGGKGRILARLYQKGYPVPDGFVIIPQAFEGDKIRPEAWEQAQAQLKRILKKNENVSFAVRSSGLSEDSAQASFAGEFETVLDVHTDEDIYTAIHTVRQSRLSERVQTYSKAKGIDIDHEIAIVVQKMVRSEISGVIFTANPITGSRTRMVGNYIHGLGDKLVSGETNSYEFTFQRPKGQYNGPSELKRVANRLYRMAKRIEEELGYPQDIEWAVAGEKLYLLQSRSITTLIGYNTTTGEWNESLTGDYLWSSVNIGEGMSDVVTPLTWSYLKMTLGLLSILPGYNMAGNICGRVYLNISLFASLFRAMGKTDQTLLDAMEGIFDFDLPEEVKIPTFPLSKFSLLTIIPNMIKMSSKQKVGVKKLPEFLVRNPKWSREMRQQIQEVQTSTGLISLWHEKIIPHLTESRWISTGCGSYYVDYTNPLRRKLIELVGAQDADALISGLSTDSEVLASLGPLIGLVKVAHGEMDREVYLDQYGHRGPHEGELLFPRPIEDPNWLDQQLVDYINAPVDIEALLAKKRTKFDSAWKRFQERYPRKASSMRKQIDQIGSRARMREAARSESTRNGIVLRTFALRAGELSGLGEDIFFLTYEEVLDVLSGDETATAHIPIRKEAYNRQTALPPYPLVINGRFDPYQWVNDPNRRNDIFDSHAPIEDINMDSKVITGFPGSAGCIEGLVQRIDDPKEADRLQSGEILVTTQTNIGWTLLFPRCAAVITDVGAPLSHAAIVARELGIPAVVGCGN